MIRKKKGMIEWLEFEIFRDQPISHGVFLREGGVSVGEYHSLNVNRIGGDIVGNALENRNRIQKCLGVETLFSANQVHGKNVMLVESGDEEFQCDGLMTQKKGVGLLVLHADCQATFFYDPPHHAIGMVHAGWKGLVQNIYKEMIGRMASTFGTRPEELLIAISPSLGPLHSEFKNYAVEFPPEFTSFQIKPTYFDLWAIARAQLEEEGVVPHHIEIAEVDTYAHPEDYFSYRREKALGKETGRHGSVIVLL